MFKWTGPLLVAFLLSACSTSVLKPDEIKKEADRPTSLAQDFADNFVKVKPEHRAIRVCLFAAAAVEVMTARVRMFDAQQAPAALGRLRALQGAAARAHTANSDWFNSDMADVALTFSRVLRDAGQERLATILLGGASLKTFVDVAKRAVIFTVKGEAALRDIRALLNSLEKGERDVESVWTTCSARMQTNGRILNAMAGVPVP